MEPIQHQGYCVKCKEKRTFEEAEVKTLANGASMAKGKCPECGCTVTRILPKSAR